ncbi:MAG: alpha/beta fold hydrolase [Thermodesulfobacteriota bacterium]
MVIVNTGHESFIFISDREETKGREVRLFLPGWGFDGRAALLFPVFEKGDMIIPTGAVTPNIIAELNSFLEKRGIKRINLVGWSLGANLGLDYALNHGEKVSSLTLAAMRTSWPAREVEKIRGGLLADPGQFMQDFYRKCFLGSPQTYKHFIKEFQEKYLINLNIDCLIDGLDYLEDYRFMSVPVSSGIKVRVLHGVRDLIAPVAERPCMDGASETLFPRLGHAVLSDERITL